MSYEFLSRFLAGVFLLLPSSDLEEAALPSLLSFLPDSDLADSCLVDSPLEALDLEEPDLLSLLAASGLWLSVLRASALGASDLRASLLRSDFSASALEELDLDEEARHELAERLGITPANLSILKTNKGKAIRFSTLMALCHELRCQPGDLLEFVDDQQEVPDGRP